MRPAIEAIPDEEVRRLLLTLRPMLKARWRNTTWWYIASAVFVVGSTSGTALARRAGLDPDQPLKDFK